MKAVLFDACGTLFTERLSRDEIYRQALAALGHDLAPADVARLRAQVHDELPEVFEGHVRYSDGWFREYVRRLLARLGSLAEPETVRAGLAAHFTRPESFVVFGDALPCLESLAERGLRLGVVSNWSPYLPPLLEDLGLARHFEVLVVSAAFGRSKPDPAIFREALRRLDLPAASVLHVGDHPLNDLAGARRAGLHAVLLERPGRAPACPADAAPASIRSLMELPEWLG